NRVAEYSLFNAIGAGVAVVGRFDVSCYSPDGKLKWETFGKNMVVNVGLQKLLDILFIGSAQVVDPWYVGLAGTTPTIASGDTMASHAGWTQMINYDEATRQEFTNVRTAEAVANTASTADFTISTASTIGGGFLGSDNTKNGSTGTLLCAVAFTGGNKSASDDDTIAVTYTFSAADS
ncbi:hypothetical protein LCGC14_2401050, partial [marine sediment metagenome]